MIDALHVYLTDEDIEKIRNNDYIELEFEKGELDGVMQILIMREEEEQK